MNNVGKTEQAGSEHRVQQSVFATLAFFDMFDCPLTHLEIQKYLYKNEIPLPEIKNIPHCGDMYFLEGRERICDLRVSNELYSAKLFDKIKRYGKWLKYIPFVRFVGLCNIAIFGFSEKSDIDLFFIIKTGRLFTARALITLLFQILGVRRYGEKIAGRFCLSFYVTERGMNLAEISLKPNDIYLYYWLRTMRPIFGQPEIYKQFLSVNNVEERFFESLIMIRDNVFSRFFRKIFEWLSGGKFGDIVESRFARWQKARALQKRDQLQDPSGIIISDDMLKFHNIDRRKMFQKRWKEIMTHFCS